MQRSELPESGDDQLNRPSVTPEPTQPSEHFAQLAVVISIAGAVLGLVALRWLRRNVVISRRV